MLGSIMIIVSIFPTEEKFVIHLKHKIDFIVEKKFGRIKSLNKRTMYVFVHLLFSVVRLVFKETLMKRTNK
jgi:hypothetical protein